MIERITIEELFHKQGAAGLDGKGSLVSLPNGSTLDVLVTYQEWPIFGLMPIDADKVISEYGLDDHWYYLLLITPRRAVIGQAYLDEPTFQVFEYLRKAKGIDEGFTHIAPEILRRTLKDQLSRKIDLILSRRP